jgi:hypothetical protein
MVLRRQQLKDSPPCPFKDKYIPLSPIWHNFKRAMDVTAGRVLWGRQTSGRKPHQPPDLGPWQTSPINQDTLFCQVQTQCKNS